MSTRARVSAPAKVNLRLHVLGRRADGYHDLETLFQAIDLSDEVVVELRESGGVELSICGDVSGLGPIADNLAFRAASRLAERVGFGGGVAVELTKRIPVGAGLGGGSSDAAAVLRGLARLLDVADDDLRLRACAEELGSDVPFFLSGSVLARGGGRGEILDPIDALPAAALVLVAPPVHVSTAQAYAALAGSRAATAAPSVPVARAPRSWSDVAAGASNDFEPVVMRMFPEIRRALDALTAHGPRFALMSGSGASVFAMFSSEEESRRVAAALSDELGWPCHVVHTLVTMPKPRIA
ncbi:MAG: 4-(cytidine 5'-diphospho)-2-C-methyl-D-erythritol kinase [Gemmatimonadales bacterium]